MQEVFEKILNDMKNKSYERRGNDGMGGELVVNLDDAIEIVKQTAEEYVTDTNVGNNGWIPCSERLPEPTRPVLVTLRNWTNEKLFVRQGRFHIDHWRTDEGIVENRVVLAWQTMPPEYQPKGE